jgi:hypothetical protein
MWLDVTGQSDKRNFALILLTVLASVVVSAALVYKPIVGVIPIGFLAFTLLLARSNSLGRDFLVLLGVLLAGYAFFSRGFAYLGYPPIFVGEIVMLVALLVIVTRILTMRIHLIHVLITCFMALGALQTLPYLEHYGVDALRDAAIWGYAIFAIAVSAVLRREHIENLTRGYVRIVPFFLLWAPFAGIVYRSALSSIPTWPTSDVTVFVFKGGDIAVHLAGVMAAVIVGLFSAFGGSRIPAPVLWILWMASAAVVLTGRAALLILVVSGLVVLAIRFMGSGVVGPKRGQPGLWFVFVSLSIVTLVVTLDVEIQTSERAISARQVGENVMSIVGVHDDEALAGTRRWRQDWWNTIVDYTVRGPYFWTGKGFGVNLANDDGFQTGREETLRSPHNGHLTILARMGVPGLVSWMLIHLTFVFSVGLTLGRAILRNDRLIAQVSAVVLVYWTAAMVNVSFDVYLEGPQGGIWFWSIVGLGIALTRFELIDETSSEPMSSA